MLIDTNVYQKMRECHAGVKSFQNWDQSTAQKSDGITTDFRMIDFDRIDGVDRHQCKMEKTRGVNSQVQVRSSRILSDDETLYLFLGIVTAVSVICVRRLNNRVFSRLYTTIGRGDIP